MNFLNTTKYRVSWMIILVIMLMPIAPISENISWAVEVNVIDNITITNEYGETQDSFSPYERIRIDVKWSIKSDVNSGDTFSLKLPKELRGFNGTVSLSDGEGNNFGTGIGNGDIITFTFSDLVDKLNNISGFFYIQSEIKYIEQQGTVEIPLEFKVNGEAIKVPITVETGSGEGTVPGEITEVFEKWGDINDEDESVVDWILRINYKGDNLYNTTITDVIDEGHEFVDGSFRLYKGYTNKETGIIENSEDVPLKYPVVFNSSINGFSLELYNTGETYTAYYKTKIIDNNKTEFTNEATLEAWSREPITKKVEVKSFTSGGEASGDLKDYKGNLRLIKHDEDNNEMLLPNTKFELINDDGKLVKILITDENGEAIADNIPGGVYILKEIEEPEGYELDRESKEIVLNFKEKHEITKKIANKKLEEPKEPESMGKIVITKANFNELSILTIDSGKQELLPGAVFEIKNREGEIVDTLVTNKDGNAESKALPHGEYTVTEIEAPKGYKLDADEQKVKINNEKSTVHLWIKNDLLSPPVEPKIEKNVNNEEHIDLKSSGEEFNYNIKVTMPKDVTGYEKLVIIDRIEKIINVNNVKVLVDEKENIELTSLVKVKDQIVTLSLGEDYTYNLLAGKDLVLQISASIKSDARLSEYEDNTVHNIAKLKLNDNPYVESNIVTVTSPQNESEEPKEPEDSDEQEEPEEPKEPKDSDEQEDPEELKEPENSDELEEPTTDIESETPLDGNDIDTDNSEDFLIEIDEKIPTGGTEIEAKESIDVLPKTGENSRLGFYAGGLLLIFLGFMLKTRIV